MSQVNLLPPELRARQKVKQLTTLIIGAGVAMIVLLLAFWFLQSQKLAGVNDDIAAQNAHELGSADADRSAAGVPAAAGGGGRPEAAAHHGVRRRGVVLADADGPVADASRPTRTSTRSTRLSRSRWRARRHPPQPSWAPSRPGGAADGFESLASWLTRLESVKGWVNPWFSTATETEPNSGLYSFQSGVDLSEDALTARGREGEPSGG